MPNSIVTIHNRATEILFFNLNIRQSLGL